MQVSYSCATTLLEVHFCKCLGGHSHCPSMYIHTRLRSHSSGFPPNQWLSITAKLIPWTWLQTTLFHLKNLPWMDGDVLVIREISSDVISKIQIAQAPWSACQWSFLRAVFYPSSLECLNKLLKWCYLFQIQVTTIYSTISPFLLRVRQRTYIR